jgi:hypothetical protein
MMGDFAHLAVDVEDDRLRRKLFRIGLEQNFDFPAAHAILDALGVPLLDAAELRAAVAQRNLVTGLVGQAHGSFDGAVPAADHENLLVDVVVGFNEPVHDFREFLAAHAEPTRSPGFSQG